MCRRGDLCLGQNIYFTREQLYYLNKLSDSFHALDTEGDLDEARVLHEVHWKVFNAVQKERQRESKNEMCF